MIFSLHGHRTSSAAPEREARESNEHINISIIDRNIKIEFKYHRAIPSACWRNIKFFSS